MIATSSTAIRALVDRGEIGAEQAVDQLIDAGDHGGRRDCFVACPECGAPFWRAWPDGRWNTCSDACQVARNTVIFDLDGGRSIVKVSELTPERVGELFGVSGLEVADAGRMAPS